MSVELSPASTLGFPRPLTQLVKRALVIHNPNPHPIAFKVKTTAPKQYCVRPNSGRVESGETVEVQVLLQPLPTDPPPHAKCKDKFLVQSAPIAPDEEMRTLTEMWAQMERTNKTAIHEQKIKCAYLPAEDGSAGANGIPEENEETQSGEPSRIEDSQIYAAAQTSPIPASGSTNKPKSPLTPTPAPRSEQSAPTPPAPQGAKAKDVSSLSANDIQLGGPSPTNVALESSLATTTSDSDKLKVALAEIDRLRAQLSEAQAPSATGLRKRGGGKGAETTVEKAKEVVTGQSGVPLEICVGLVVGVFVLTYLFV